MLSPEPDETIVFSNPLLWLARSKLEILLVLLNTDELARGQALLREALAGDTNFTFPPENGHDASLPLFALGSAWLRLPSQGSLSPDTCCHFGTAFAKNLEFSAYYRSAFLAPEEEELVAMEVGSPPLPKKSAPAGQLDQPPTRIGTKLSPEPPGSKPEPQDSKAQNLTTCEVCGACFETRKGLSSHARSHLRQLGVAESESSGAPIDLLYELMKQKGKPDGSPMSPALGKKSGSPKDATAGSPRPTLLALGKAGDRLADGPVNKAIKSPPGFSKNLSQPGSPILKKVPPALSGSPSPKNPEEKSSKLSLSPLQSSPKAQWPQADEEGPLNLTSGSEPVRDIRCEFCGEYFENRKGLSSHARSHLRQMGVTEWSVNGSPIDTLREILKKKSKPCVIKKEPHTSSIEPPKSIGEEGTDPKSPGKILQGMALPPLGGRTGKPSPGASTLNREISLSPLTSKPQGSFLTPLSAKRPLQDDRLGPHAEVKHKAYIQTELPFKTKSVHDKPAHTSSEACCELCGLYFENRKALASHARAHLRQFGVTEWCVNGSPIETLSEWIRHRPQKAGAYRSYIQGGRPFTKKFRNSSHARDHDGGARRMPLSLQAGGVTLLSKGLTGDLAHGDAGKILDGGSSGERPMITSPLSLVKVEEHQRSNINRQPPPRMRPVPSLVPPPPQTSLVKFVGNIYTLKCRFCEVEFQGPLSIQEEWVRHLQRHILEMNFSKADPLRGEDPPPPEPPTLAEAQ
ncbi:PREDICTED: protein Wiz [Nipponia nippon]|nr:PREDICTED: protein Wiz [Nipponia nippon]